MRKSAGNEGDIYINNTGYILGDCITGHKNTIIKIIIMNTNDKKINETVDSLNNLSKSQVVLSEAILKQRENDSQQNEALLTLTRTMENNSLANLRLAESLLKDKEIMERLLDILEQSIKTN